MYVSLTALVCLGNHTSKLQTKFSVHVRVAMDWSSSDDSAVGYVLLVL